MCVFVCMFHRPAPTKRAFDMRFLPKVHKFIRECSWRKKFLVRCTEIPVYTGVPKYRNRKKGFKKSPKWQKWSKRDAVFCKKDAENVFLNFGEIFVLVRCTEIPKYRHTEIPKCPKKALENRQNVKNGQKRMISFAKVAENVFLNFWRIFLFVGG